MEISRIRALRGPNLWSRNTSIEAVVTCPPHQCCVDQVVGGRDPGAAQRHDIDLVGELGQVRAQTLDRVVYDRAGTEAVAQPLSHPAAHGAVADDADDQH